MQIDLSDKEIKFLIRVLVQNYAEEMDDFVQGMNLNSDGIASDLLNKVMYEDLNTFKKAHKERCIEEPLNEKLFMGSGVHALDLENRLHKRLVFAFIQLSGSQQNGGRGDFDEEYEKQSSQDIKDVLKDLLVAFDLKPDDLK
jgi:hypothetical protein